MKREDIINSYLLGQLVLKLIEHSPSFKDEYKALAPDVAAEIESASTNPNCTCRSKVTHFTMRNSELVGGLVFSFASKNNTLGQIEQTLKELDEIEIKPEQIVSGKVAKTTVAGWADFAKSVNDSKLSFQHFSTSMIGDDVYVFFL